MKFALPEAILVKNYIFDFLDHIVGVEGHLAFRTVLGKKSEDKKLKVLKCNFSKFLVILSLILIRKVRSVETFSFSNPPNGSMGRHGS